MKSSEVNESIVVLLWVVLFSRFSRSWRRACFVLFSHRVLCLSPPLFGCCLLPLLCGWCCFPLLLLLGVGAFLRLLAVVLPFSSKIELNTVNAIKRSHIRRSVREFFFDRELSFLRLLYFWWVADLWEGHLKEMRSKSKFRPARRARQTNPDSLAPSLYSTRHHTTLHDTEPHRSSGS